MSTNYAGFWPRLVAIIIDLIILGIAQSFIIVPILAVMGLGFLGNMGEMDMNDSESIVGMIGAIIAMAGTYWILATSIRILYFSFMESSNSQATIGKMAMGLVVTDLNGGKLDFGKAFVRNICKIISDFTCLIGYIIAAFTEKRQALHDIIAGTLVMKKASA